MAEIAGPWTMESFDETSRGWRLIYRRLDPERFSPALPDGRSTLLVRRDTGEIEHESRSGYPPLRSMSSIR